MFVSVLLWCYGYGTLDCSLCEPRASSRWTIDRSLAAHSILASCLGDATGIDIALRANISRVSPDVSGALYLDHSRVEHALQEWSRHIGVTQAVKAMRLLMRYYHARCVCRAGLIGHLETMCNNRDIAHCIASFLWSDRSWQGCPSQVVCLCGFFSIWVVSVLCSRCQFSAAKMKDKMCQCPWVMRSMDRCATTGTSLARIDFS